MQFMYETDRLHLRILPAEYAPVVCCFYQENKAFLEPFEPRRPENFYTADFQRSNLLCEYNAFLKHSYLRYWIFLAGWPDMPIGTVCFSNIQHGAFEKCTLGYKLGRDYCHCGYMHEALSLLVPLIMKNIHLHRMEAYVQPDNFPSIRLLAKLGFTKEGYLREYAEIYGKWTDHLLFSYLGNS